MSAGTIFKNTNNSAKFPFSNLAFVFLAIRYTITTVADAIMWRRLFSIFMKYWLLFLTFLFLLSSIKLHGRMELGLNSMGFLEKRKHKMVLFIISEIKGDMLIYPW